MSVAKKNAQTLLNRVKNARVQLEGLLKDRSWIEEAKKAAGKQGTEVRKMIHSDVAKLRGFIEKERKELGKLQAQIPGEVDKLKKFVDGRKKELARLLAQVKSNAGKKAGQSKKAAKKNASKGAAKKAAPKKTRTAQKNGASSASGTAT